jgi:hypothetical protein
MSLTKLYLDGNNLYMTLLFPPRESLVSDKVTSCLGMGISESFFYGVMTLNTGERVCTFAGKLFDVGVEYIAYRKQ